MKEPAVYILTNRRGGVLYTGVTSNLVGRVYQHKHESTHGFAHKYACTVLVFYECCGTMEAAIMREKQIKAGSRMAKIRLIEGMNPNWKDLWEDILP